MGDAVACPALSASCAACPLATRSSLYNRDTLTWKRLPMASHYDLEEQEQIAQLKAFWARYGNLITWLVTLALLAYAGYTGWEYWQRRQAQQAAALLDELEVAVQARDSERVRRVWSDLRDQTPRTTQAQHGALLAARAFAQADLGAEARAALQFVIDRSDDEGLVAIARLRLAGLLIDANELDGAQRLLEAAVPPALRAWQADRLGDLRQRQGQMDAARSAYLQAWQALTDDIAYRGVVEAKLNALGVDPQAAPEGKP